MLQNIWQDIRAQFRQGNAVTRIVLVNLFVFLGLGLLYVFIFWGNGGELPAFFKNYWQYLSISADFKEILFRPWTLITHMFLHLHGGIWHLVFNLLIFFWFGRILGDLIGDRFILPIYILSGLAGALVFIITANLGFFPSGYAYGASAAVMGIVMAAAAVSPDFEMNLILIGPVKIKWIALTLFVLDIFGTTTNINTGGAFAHVGGAIFGGFFIYSLRNGRDYSKPITAVIDWFKSLFATAEPKAARQKSNLKVVHKKKGEHQSDKTISGSHQERLDAILEKIKKSGYDSLSEVEKDFLNEASKGKV